MRSCGGIPSSKPRGEPGGPALGWMSDIGAEREAAGFAGHLYAALAQPGDRSADNVDAGNLLASDGEAGLLTAVAQPISFDRHETEVPIRKTFREANSAAGVQADKS